MDKLAQMQSLTKIVSKLSLFKGLNLSESSRLLKVCTFKTFAPKEVIYRFGQPSEEMLILLQGQLQALGGSGVELGKIGPGTSCGEMGVFTGHRRSATIVASSNASGFVISKRDLAQALKTDPDTHIKILKNIVILLSERLENADQSIESFAEELENKKDSNETQDKGEQ